MEDSNLRMFQDSTVEKAKKLLIEHGTFTPVAFVHCLRSAVSPKLRALLKDLQGNDVPASDSPTDVFVMQIPLIVPDHWILNVFELYHKDMEMLGTLKHLKEQGNRIGLSDHQVSLYLGAHLKNASGLDDLGIGNLLLKGVLRESEAFAYVRVHESIFKKVAPNEKAEMATIESIKDDPAAQTCIFTLLETRKMQRTVILPYSRDEKDPDILKFLEKVELIADENGNSNEGRLQGLLYHPAKDEEAKTPAVSNGTLLN